MLSVLQELREFEAIYCQVTVPEAQLESLRLQMAQIHAIADIDGHRQASQLRTCCVCYDDVQSTEGLQCPDPLQARKDDHFACASCADRYVREEIANNKEHVCCVEADCTARYSDTALARALPEGGFMLYLAAKEGLRVRVAVTEDRATQAAAMAAQAARTEEDREAMTRKEHVVKHILEQSCPKCHTGFDFDGGCFALQCRNIMCAAAFCGYCFHVAPAGDAHTHTARCEFNIFGLFGGDPANKRVQLWNFASAQDSRRVRGLRLYMVALLPGQRHRLLRDLTVHLRDYTLSEENFQDGLLCIVKNVQVILDK